MKKERLIQEVSKRLEIIDSALEAIKDLCANVDDELGTFAEDWSADAEEGLSPERIEELIEKINEIYELQEDDE